MRPLRRVLALFALAILACSGPVEVPGEPPGAREYWVERSGSELEALLDQTCATAVAEDKPVLLAFSAPWCMDCRQVRILSVEEPLRSEREVWEEVVVHVGRFTRHRDLLEAFDVKAIAYWVALQPTTCDAPVTAWPVLRQGTFEPLSNPNAGRTSVELARWLREARGAG